MGELLIAYTDAAGRLHVCRHRHRALADFVAADTAAEPAP